MEQSEHSGIGFRWPMLTALGLSVLAFLTALVWSWSGGGGGPPGVESTEQDSQQGPDDLVPADPRSTRGSEESSRSEVASIATGAVSFLDSATRDPVPEVRIGFVHGGRRLSRTTDPLGQVRLPAGDWTIEALSAPWSTEDPGLTVDPHAASTVHWLARTTELSVLVESIWATPLVGAVVSWYDADDDEGAAAIPRPDRKAWTDGRGMARFPDWRSTPGRIVASAAGHEMAVVPVRGPAQDDLLRVTLKPVNGETTFSVSFVHRDGTPAVNARLDTSGGRTVECDEDGRLIVDEALLSELPLAVSENQGYFPVRIKSLVAEQSIILPRSVESRLVIVGGDDRLGFQVHRQWGPDRGDGFEIRPDDRVVHERVTPLLIPADATCSILATDGFGSHGRVDLTGSLSPEVVLRLDGGPRLRIHLDGRAELPSQSLFAEVHYLGDNDGYQVESHVRLHPVTSDTLEIPRPGEAWRIRILSGDLVVMKLGLSPPGSAVDDEKAAGDLTVALEPPSTSVVRVATAGGQPVAGVLLEIVSAKPVTVPWPSDLRTEHPSWVLYPPDIQELISDGQGKAVVSAIPGSYEISVELPVEYSGSTYQPWIYREASKRVQLPSEDTIEITVPPIVFREIRVHERWSGLPVTQFEISGPDNAWRIPVEGSHWQGWTHDEELTITVAGLGSTSLDVGSENHTVVEVEADSPCQVWLLGWSEAGVRELRLGTERSDSGNFFMKEIELDLVQEGRFRVHLPPGSRFWLAGSTPTGSFKTPIFEWRAGAIYEFPLDRE